LLDVLKIQLSCEPYEDKVTMDNVIKVLNANDEISEEARDFLIEAAKSANLKYQSAKLPEFKTELETIFELAQERTKGVYKRNAKGVSLLLGFIVAGLSNADTFKIVSTLSQNSNNISSTIVSELIKKQEILTCSSDASSEKYEECLRNLAPQLREMAETINPGTPLPLGWDFDEKVSNQAQQSAIQSLDEQITNVDTLTTILDKYIPLFENAEKTAKDIVKRDAEQAEPEETKEQKKTHEEAKANETEEQKKNREQAEVDEIKKEKEKLQKNYFKKLLTDLEEKPVLDSKNFDELNLEKAQKDLNAYETTLAKLNNRLREEQSTFSLKKIEIEIEIEGNKHIEIEDIIEEQGGWGQVGLGWFISAIAISMGAPFWFDLLARVMNVRNTGKPPEAKQN
jgi:hypothetical protein